MWFCQGYTIWVDGMHCVYAPLPYLRGILRRVFETGTVVIHTNNLPYFIGCLFNIERPLDWWISDPQMRVWERGVKKLRRWYTNDFFRKTSVVQIFNYRGKKPTKTFPMSISYFMNTISQRDRSVCHVLHIRISLDVPLISFWLLLKQQQKHITINWSPINVTVPRLLAMNTYSFA